MKFIVVILCVCLVQQSYSQSPLFNKYFKDSVNLTDEMKNELTKDIRNEVNGGSEQFVDDFVSIYEKLQNNTFARDAVSKNFFV